MIYTWSFDEARKQLEPAERIKRCISIAQKTPSDFGRCARLSELAPSDGLVCAWQQGMSVFHYKQAYWRNILMGLDPIEVYRGIPDDSILLCWCPSDSFCHRHLVSIWFGLVGHPCCEIET